MLASALGALTSVPPSADRKRFPPLEEITVSDLFRTPPVSPIEQADFLNAAVTASTRLRPADLLAALKLCEQLLGRRRGERWGPRPVDLDLLVYGDLVTRTPELTIPHPRLRQRRFYLEPLAQIAPTLRIPPDGATVGDLLSQAPEAPSRRLPWPRGRADLPPGRPIA